MVSRLFGSVSRLRSVSVRFRYLFLLVLVFASSFLLLSINNGVQILTLNNNIEPTTWDINGYHIDDSDATFTIKTDGCTIPGLQPFDASINKFVEPPTKLKSCPNNNISLITSNDTHIWVQRDNLKYYGVPDDGVLKCCYKSLYRPAYIDDIGSYNIDNRVKYEDCIFFADSIDVKHEFVRLTCKNGDIIIYDQFFLFAMKKELVTNRDDPSLSLQNKTAYNVIIMGIDAVSRLNFHRTMPKTAAYLKNKGAIELFGYNKVGDNTFPNVIPMLLGIRDKDLNKTCWPNMRRTFDNCPFIWEWFKEAGYYTALGEDSAYLGTFNYEKIGFSGTPTDYYLHTFIHEAEIGVGNNKDFNSVLCMGDKYFYQVVLDYIESLTTTLKSNKLFGFFWEVTMSHDYLNYPMAMDESYLKFLRNLDGARYLDNTIMIFISDHGIRWGKIRYTKQGRLEERLPLVNILLPQSFRKNYSKAFENLKTNSGRLTTPFDIHETLADLTNLNSITNEEIESRSKELYMNSKKVSLFLPVPTNRTCESAGIEEHWCTCNRGSRHAVESVEAQETSIELLRQINLLTKDHSQCARLRLAAILEVTELHAGQANAGEEGWREFLVVARMEPGGGVFEATLRNHSTGGWALAGNPSRLNLYGNQSRCVHDFRLKLYCYCLS